jgi:hypothetical protein
VSVARYFTQVELRKASAFDVKESGHAAGIYRQSARTGYAIFVGRWPIASQPKAEHIERRDVDIIRI